MGEGIGIRNWDKTAVQLPEATYQPSHRLALLVLIERREVWVPIAAGRHVPAAGTGESAPPGESP